MYRPDPKAAVFNTVDVPSVDEFIQKITGAGCTVVMPKTAVPGIGYLAYFADTEGNVFGICRTIHRAGSSRPHVKTDVPPEGKT